MKVLIVDDEVAIQQIISFMLESQLKVTSIYASSGNQAIEILKSDPEIDCVISDYSMVDGNGGDISKYLIESHSDIPFILCSTYRPEALTHFKAHPPQGYVQKPNLFPALYDQITALPMKSAKVPLEDEYCKIRSDLVLKLGLLNFDFYIQLNAHKYVKVFRKDDVFELADFERFEEKKIKYFYLKASDSKEVLGLMMKNINRLAETGDVSRDQAVELSTSSLEFIATFNSAFGLSAEVQELTHATIKMVIQTIQTNEKLAKLFEYFLVDQDSYLVSHSIVLSYFTCGLASMLGWNSEITFYILTLSSFFHDLSLETDELSRIRSLEELEAANPPFTEEEKAKFKAHPETNSKLIDQLSESPAYVSTIILQHHQTPDGKGFPGPLDLKKLHPLAALFMVAEDLVSLNDDPNEKVDIAKFIQDRTAFYSKEPFKKVIQTMAKALES